MSNIVPNFAKLRWAPLVRSHLDGQQIVLRHDKYGLSLVNAPMLHSFEFAWEIAIVEYHSGKTGSSWSLTYETPLTTDVEVFMTDDEARAFVVKAFEWFEEQKDKE